MPVSSAGHLPHVTSTSFPALVSYLGSNYNAQRVSGWTVSIRIFRSSFENSQEGTSRPRLMYVVGLSEMPSETFVLVEDSEKDTRASTKARLAAQKQQEILINDPASPPPTENIAQLKASLQTASTRYTLFSASSNFPALLSRLNLPAPLGAPSMGDGVTNAQASGGPGAWLPRGAPIVIEGATYELPSATRYGVEELNEGGNCEWRVRLGMLQSGGTRSAGAIVEVSAGEKGDCGFGQATLTGAAQNEYMPLNRLNDPTLLLSHLQSLFPHYLSNPTQSGATHALSGISMNHPTPEQWEEVIPASNEAWCDGLGKVKAQDQTGWKGKERGRRLAYLYILLLRNQGIL